MRYRCETVAKALRGCREALAMLSRRRHEAAARLLRLGSKMITVFLRSCGEAVEHVAKSLWRDREVAKMFDAVAMLLRSRYWLSECWLRSREACSEAVPMRRCSVVHAKPSLRLRNYSKWFSAAPTTSTIQSDVYRYLASGSWLYQVPEALGAGFPL